MEDKKKRGCNYTAAEKEMFLELIKKYLAIIENKETNSHMILKKRKTWDTICQQYNAVAMSGPRTCHQLRHLYENIKQRSKKNIAKDNRLQFYEKTKEVQRKASIDKKEVNRTGGGPYKSTLTDQDNQILAMVAPQVQPLPNPFDNAAFYFGDTEQYADVIDTSQNNGEAPSDILINNTDNIVDISIPNSSDKRNKPCTVTSECINAMPEAIVVIEEPEPSIMETSIDHPKKKQQILSSSKSTEKVKFNSKGNVKQQYFMTKLKNAKLEAKYLMNKNKIQMNKYKFEVNKYKLEMQILKLRLNKLKSRN